MSMHACVQVHVALAEAVVPCACIVPQLEAGIKIYALGWRTYRKVSEEAAWTTWPVLARKQGWQQP